MRDSAWRWRIVKNAKIFIKLARVVNSKLTFTD